MIEGWLKNQYGKAGRVLSIETSVGAAVPVLVPFKNATLSAPRRISRRRQRPPDLIYALKLIFKLAGLYNGLYRSSRDLCAVFGLQQGAQPRCFLSCVGVLQQVGELCLRGCHAEFLGS